MELIPSFCMTIGCLQYYQSLQDAQRSQSITRQAAVCELNTVWPRDFNHRVYYFHCPHYIRFLESHNGSQIKPLSVSWIWFGQGIPIPELTIFNCPHGIIPLHDYSMSPIILSIVNKLSDSQMLTTHHKPSSCLWAGYSMAMKFQSQSLLR